LEESVAHQIQHVLRLRAGQHVVVLDNSGAEYEVELEAATGGAMSGRIVARRPAGGEPRVRITLYQALLKLDKFEWLLQKGTEVGVAAFQPIVSARVVRAEVKPHRLERWQRIVREAAEQSERGIIPPLAEPMTFEQAVENVGRDALAIIPYEEERTRSLRDVLRGKDLTGLEDPSGLSIHLFIGPEGGFTLDEIEFAIQHRVIPLTLGPRILRAETAGLVAASAILYECGDL